MKLLKVYADTSVWGAIWDKEDQGRIETTRAFLETIRNKKIEGFISNVVIAEIHKAPMEISGQISRLLSEIGPLVLEENEECGELAEAYLREQVVPEKFRDDGRHIAIAVVHEIDVIVSWNFRHMVNLVAKRKVNAVNLKLGYRSIEILAPPEVITYGEMGV